LFASTLLKAGRIESFLTSARTFHERPFGGRVALCHPHHEGGG
jgi:hypothetical protein